MARQRFREKSVMFDSGGGSRRSMEMSGDSYNWRGGCG
jgi:hypothetical protein